VKLRKLVATVRTPTPKIVKSADFFYLFYNNGC